MCYRIGWNPAIYNVDNVNVPLNSTVLARGTVVLPAGEVATFFRQVSTCVGLLILHLTLSRVDRDARLQTYPVTVEVSEATRTYRGSPEVRGFFG